MSLWKKDQNVPSQDNSLTKCKRQTSPSNVVLATSASRVINKNSKFCSQLQSHGIIITSYAGTKILILLNQQPIKLHAIHTQCWKQADYIFSTLFPLKVQEMVRWSTYAFSQNISTQASCLRHSGQSLRWFFHQCQRYVTFWTHILMTATPVLIGLSHSWVLVSGLPAWR